MEGTLKTLIRLAEIAAMSYRLSGSRKRIEEMNQFLDNALELAVTRDLANFIVDIHVIKALLAAFDLNYEYCLEELELAKTVAQKGQLELLVNRVGALCQEITGKRDEQVQKLSSESLSFDEITDYMNEASKFLGSME